MMIEVYILRDGKRVVFIVLKNHDRKIIQRAWQSWPGGEFEVIDPRTITISQIASVESMAIPQICESG